MPPNRKAKKEERVFHGFLNHWLDDKEEKYLKTQKWDDNRFIEVFNALVDEGFQLSFKFDAYNDCFQVAVSHTSPDYEHFGWILVGRGSTPVKALKQFAYIHYEFLQGDWAALYKSGKTKRKIDD